jgi:hypothetical protein
MVLRTHPDSTPVRLDLLVRINQAAMAAFSFWSVFQFHGSRSATLVGEPGQNIRKPGLGIDFVHCRSRQVYIRRRRDGLRRLSRRMSNSFFRPPQRAELVRRRCW